MSDLKERVKQLKEQIAKLNNELHETKVKLAHQECPFKIGDKVINRRGVIAVISVILPGRFDFHDYSFRVSRIKKDGKPYANNIDTYDYEEWRLSDGES